MTLRRGEEMGAEMAQLGPRSWAVLDFDLLEERGGEGTGFWGRSDGRDKGRSERLFAFGVCPPFAFIS